MALNLFLYLKKLKPSIYVYISPSSKQFTNTPVITSLEIVIFSNKELSLVISLWNTPLYFNLSTYVNDSTESPLYNMYLFSPLIYSELNKSDILFPFDVLYLLLHHQHLLLF